MTDAADGPWPQYVVGLGEVSHREFLAASMAEIELRAAVEKMRRLGGAYWTLQILNVEQATIAASLKRSKGRPKNSGAVSELNLVILVSMLRRVNPDAKPSEIANKIYASRTVRTNSEAALTRLVQRLLQDAEALGGLDKLLDKAVEVALLNEMAGGHFAKIDPAIVPPLRRLAAGKPLTETEAKLVRSVFKHGPEVPGDKK